MKRAIVLLAVSLVLCAAILPSPASAGGNRHGGHRGGHGGRWWPGAIVGGLALGAVAVVTAPIWALSAAAASVAEAPPVVYAPPAYSAPPTYYSVPPPYSAPPMYSAPPTYSAPPAYVTPPPTSYRQAPRYAPAQVPAVQREVVYANGRYVLYGDGVYQPWQWVWVPSASPPPPAPPPPH